MAIIKKAVEWGGNAVENVFEGLVLYQLKAAENMVKNTLKCLHKSLILAPVDIVKGVKEAVASPDTLQKMTLGAAKEFVGGLGGIITSTRDALDKVWGGASAILFDEAKPGLFANLGWVLKQWGWEAPKTLIKGILYDNLLKKSVLGTAKNILGGGANTIVETVTGVKEGIVHLLEGQQDLWQYGALNSTALVPTGILHGTIGALLNKDFGPAYDRLFPGVLSSGIIPTSHTLAPPPAPITAPAPAPAPPPPAPAPGGGSGGSGSGSGSGSGGGGGTP